MMRTIASIVIGGVLLIAIVCILLSMVTVKGTVEFRPVTRTPAVEQNWWEAEER
jgi:hypothetical protein